MLEGRHGEGKDDDSVACEEGSPRQAKDVFGNPVGWRVDALSNGLVPEDTEANISDTSLGRDMMPIWKGEKQLTPSNGAV